MKNIKNTLRIICEIFRKCFWEDSDIIIIIIGLVVSQLFIFTPLLFTGSLSDIIQNAMLLLSFFSGEILTVGFIILALFLINIIQNVKIILKHPFKLSDDFTRGPPSHKKRIIIDELINLKQKESAVCTALIFALYSALIIRAVSKHEAMNILYALLFFALVLLCNLRQLLAKYRRDHGLFGTCEAEAEEIISIMIELKQKSSNNGVPPKLQFTPEDLEKIVYGQTTGGEVNA